MSPETLFPEETTAPAAPAHLPLTHPPLTQLPLEQLPLEQPPLEHPPPAPLPPGRGVDVGAVAVRSALTRQQGGSARWFDWSANPYRGCEFACGYCYARGTHRWLGHDDPRDFERRLYVKDGFVQALRRDLRTRVRPGEHIAFGTATDPYQPIERREGVMQAVLRELSRASGLRVSITTKSTLVTRDIDLLRAVARRNAVRVNVTITTPDPRLARFLEPRAPAPSARLHAVRTLTGAGIAAGVFLMPVLPGITDADVDLRALFRAAAAAGAHHLVHGVVFLEGPTREHFLSSLRRAYPRVAARYEVWTRTGRTVPPDVRREIAERIARFAREFRIGGAALPACAGADAGTGRGGASPDPDHARRRSTADPFFDAGPTGNPQAQRTFAFAG